MSTMSNIKYGMGQWRYKNNQNYYDKLSYSKTFYKVNMGIDGEGFYYRDNIITLSDNDFNYFERDVPYLLSLRIPKHPIYSCSYKLKLISNPAEPAAEDAALHDKLSYQLLRYINVPRQSGVNQSIKVVVFQDPREEISSDSAATIVSEAVLDPEDLTKETFPIYKTVLFKDDKYYLWKGNNKLFNIDNYVEIKNFEDVFVEPNWINQEWNTNDPDNYVFYNIIFSFKGNSDILRNCGTIWLEMVRNNFDYDIYNGDYYGRDMPLDNLDVKIYKLKNLLDTSDDNISSLSHIGIYSHPDFMFAINNEELRIGQTGYFELNDYEITSIAVAPINENLQDNIFTIDYQYLIEDISNNEVETGN